MIYACKFLYRKSLEVRPKCRSCIKSLRYSLILQIPLPDGWKYYIHPKGWVYYYNASQRLVTDYRMEYRLGQQEFEHALKETEAFGYPAHQLPQYCEIWIDFKLQDGRSVPEKLFVDHAKRRLTPNAPPHRRRYSTVPEPQRSPDTEEGTWADDEIDVWQRALLLLFALYSFSRLC